MQGEFEARGICPEDRKIVITCYACQVFGLFIDWLENGLQEDFLPELTRLCELRSGSIETALSRCRTA